MKFKKFVLITWEDICSYSDWKNIDTAKKDTVAICYSAGFIIEKNKKIQLFVLIGLVILMELK